MSGKILIEEKKYICVNIDNIIGKMCAGFDF